ncbi:MarR family winged helix-turn-helix transcriptional regulator [Novosphingobium sp. G106]|uniref:MarR family winged helix-turn-helix transcriptional regulator n=1 Tax=Novosphingobium sp. G106 TaxID=2849500 RepID=UPI001C2DC1F7|nr:MarR family winged helix-turn-helix transcriptional regulator [Novosphingobium sp. G106]MBV1691291.1 MarR family winged helix-turn-helix transcriptional regulator [Novosphingobium sp. G106]
MTHNFLKITATGLDGDADRILSAGKAPDDIPGSSDGSDDAQPALPMSAPEAENSIRDQETPSNLAGSGDAHLIDFAESLYRSRQRRAHFFPQDLLGEPGWDLLLDLFIQHSRRHLISTTSACIASGVPPTTALRWISVLEARGLVTRTKADGDHRVNNIALTGLGADMVREYLADVWEAFWR